jgi:serine/threonine protein kinase
VTKIVYQIALALDGLHERGYIYRNVCPESILIAPDGYMLLADFKETYEKSQRAREYYMETNSRDPDKNPKLIGEAEAWERFK